jgi:type VI secretion system protein ImpB
LFWTAVVQERPFLAIDLSNFDDVMQEIGPRLALRVSNKLADDDSRLGIDLRFRLLADFSPTNIARQVSPLAKLLELRTKVAAAPANGSER